METKKKRIEELVGILNEASGAYYQGQEEKMSNYEWDAMFDELTALEQETGYILPDSPTPVSYTHLDVYKRQEQLGVIFDECNMPVEFTAKEIYHIMNEFYRTWEGKEIFCLFKEASGSYRQEGKGFVEGNEIPDEQIIGKMENAYGAHVLVKNAAGWKQEGFVVDHASIEDILLYIVKRDEVR